MPPLIEEKQICIALAGNPNSGKTTLFNRLTGLRQKVGNYPGITVEKKLGTFSHNGKETLILDLPGTYGLSPRDEEEKIASEVIQGLRKDVPPIHGVLCVADSTCLERSLYLVLQILKAGIPTALLLNMSDELEKRGAEIDVQKLSALLKIPVFLVSARNGTGVKEVRKCIENWANKDPINQPHHSLFELTPDEINERRKKSKGICAQILRKKLEPHPWSDKIDKFVMNRMWGSLIFAGVVILVFQSIFTWAQPAMDFIDTLFQGVRSLLSQNLPDGIFRSFLVNGVVAGVGSVVIFLPQILIVFFFIALLENSGYMARAAMVMDRFFLKIGLQGKSFLPLISSYACAVPGIMAARTIENKRDRIATILIAPFMTCSARLPVYALLIGAFVPNIPLIKGVIGLRAVTLLILYAMGFLAAVFTALLLKSNVLKPSRIPFILDIPPYRIPTLKTILLLMWDRSKIFLKRAGTIILGASILMWVLVSFPQSEGPNQIENSYAGKIGHFIEPAIRPLGFDWKIGVGLLGAQVAREVMVSTLSTIYLVDQQNSNQRASLQETLKSQMTPLTAVSLMVFFVFAMQCMSTLAIAKRETNGWKFPIIMFLYMNAMAYVASLLVYQGGKLLGFT